MPTPNFPVVGITAPFVVSVVMWWVTGSTFALLGAVIAPTMVFAHFLDARRRARRDARHRHEKQAREDAARQQAEFRQWQVDIAALQRTHPSIADIARLDNWVPPRDGNPLVRAGKYADGRPWLVDISGGVAVAGEGSAAESVWASLVLQGSAQLGEPETNNNEHRWPSGAMIIRGESSAAALTIRCAGDLILSIGRRGTIPATADTIADDTTLGDRVRARLGAPEVASLSLNLTSSTPHVLFAGRTGSGKSRALAAVMTDWATRMSPAEFTFVGIDFKGGATLRSLEKFPHHLGTLTDLTDRDVPRALLGIAAELRRREWILRERGVSSIEHTTAMPRLAIVVDEVHEFLRRFPAAQDVLGDIARRGRSLGVHLVLAVQHPTGVLRDSVLGNIPVRVCLAMNTPHDVMSVLGRPTNLTPSPGHALVTIGDGHVREVAVPNNSDPATVRLHDTPTQNPLWRPALDHPVPRDGRTGFGLIDDVVGAQYSPAMWEPSDGDVVIIGDAGSGRTMAARAMVDGCNATWATSPRQVIDSSGVVVIDNLDCVLSSLSPSGASEFLEAITVARQSRTRFVVTSSTLLPRGLSGFRDTLTLRRATMEEHRAAGAPAETFDPASAPGVGTWRGQRVVIYASTDSTNTASIP